MRFSSAITILMLLCTIANAQSLPKQVDMKDLVIGKTIEIESVELSEKRKLNIYLPASYSEDSSKTYPVIYVLDGGMDEDFLHITGIAQFGAFPWIHMLPEAIVVGIVNVDRKRDFTFPSNRKKDKKTMPTSGGSERFIKFLTNELLPFVDAHYRTGHSNTLIGQSLGGLLASEILLKSPGLFDNYIIVSPSLWWDKESLLKETSIDYASVNAVCIFVGKEGKAMERTAKELFRILATHPNKNTHVHFEILHDKTHGDALHHAVYKGFEHVFKTP